MSKVSKSFKRRVSSIFRKRHADVRVGPALPEEHDLKDPPKHTPLDFSGEEATVRLEESESELSLINTSSSLLSVGGSYSEAETKANVPLDVCEEVKTPPRPTKKVSFDDVTVRHYDLILGDNPHVKYPLALGWNYRQEHVQSVNAFEDDRSHRQAQKQEERIQPRLYVASEETPTTGVGGAFVHEVHSEEDFDDHKGRIYELSMQERRTRLRAFGYSEASLRQAERRRCVRLALEWTEAGTPTRFPYSRQFLNRYTK